MRALTQYSGLAIAILIGAEFSSAEAGYVFLKNGYILQGKISEKTDEKVVLDYPGGQVTVFERFVKHVVLDPAEEALNKRSMQEARRVTAELPVLETDVPLELPSIDELVRLGSESTMDPLIPLEPVVDDGNPTDTTDTRPRVEVVEVAPVDPTFSTDPVDAADPEDATVERLPEEAPPVVAVNVGVSVRPPVGWSVDQTHPDVFRLVAHDAENAAVLTLQRLKKTDLSLAQAAKTLRETLESSYSDLRVVDERDLQLGLERARSVILEDSTTGARFSQVLVGRDQSLLLIGLRWDRDAKLDREVLERCMHSLAFVD